MVTCTGLDTAYQVAFSNGTYSGVSDAPADKGGAGQGFRPHELLEAALGSCTSIVLRVYAEKHGIALTGVTVSVNLEHEEPGKAKFVCRIALSGDLTPQQRQQLLRAARACPVRRTLSGTLVFEEKEDEAAV